jgi:hypothetical protein
LLLVLGTPAKIRSRIKSRRGIKKRSLLSDSFSHLVRWWGRLLPVVDHFPHDEDDEHDYER